MIKNKLRYFLRVILGTRKNETIDNSINRKKVKIKKIFYKKPISIDDFRAALVRLGVTEGDNLMVHASWREFYNFEGTPENVIKIFENILGENGTLLMPSYGSDRTFFDVDNSPSNAGVLSEIFRLQKNTYRSACTHFSICASGKNSYELTNKHFYSEYGFDDNSPYYLFTNTDNSKVIFIGLGEKPTQISLFHCVGYMLKNKIPYFENLLSHRYISTLIKEGNEYKKEMIIRKPGHKNNKKVFKKILKSIKNKKHIRLSNIDLVTVDAKEGLRAAIKFAENGVYCYK